MAAATQKAPAPTPEAAVPRAAVRVPRQPGPVVEMPEQFRVQPIEDDDAPEQLDDDTEPSDLSEASDPGDTDPEALEEEADAEVEAAGDAEGKQPQRSVDDYVAITLNEPQRLAEVPPRLRTQVIQARDAAIATHFQSREQEVFNAGHERGMEAGRTAALQALEYEHVKGLVPDDREAYFRDTPGSEQRFIAARSAELNPKPVANAAPAAAQLLNARALAVDNMTKGEADVYARLQTNTKAGKYPLTEAGIAALEADARAYLRDPKAAAAPPPEAAAAKALRAAPRTAAGQGGSSAAGGLPTDAQIRGWTQKQMYDAMGDPKMAAHIERLQRIRAGGKA